MWIVLLVVAVVVLCFTAYRLDKKDENIEAALLYMVCIIISLSIFLQTMSYW